MTAIYFGGLHVLFIRVTFHSFMYITVTETRKTLAGTVKELLCY